MALQACRKLFFQSMSLNFVKKNDMKKRFYKQNGIWYIDLPEFLEQGLGTLADLMMVDGADTFLDHLAVNQSEVVVCFSEKPFDEAKFTLLTEAQGKNNSLFSFLRFVPSQYGCYYRVSELNNHRLWLCPVTKFVFGRYPDRIWVG
jgi:hypothetical protein